MLHPLILVVPNARTHFEVRCSFTRVSQLHRTSLKQCLARRVLRQFHTDPPSIPDRGVRLLQPVVLSSLLVFSDEVATECVQQHASSGVVCRSCWLWQP